MNLQTVAAPQGLHGLSKMAQVLRWEADTASIRNIEAISNSQPLTKNSFSPMKYHWAYKPHLRASGNGQHKMNSMVLSEICVCFLLFWVFLCLFLERDLKCFVWETMVSNFVLMDFLCVWSMCLSVMVCFLCLSWFTFVCYFVLF